MFSWEGPERIRISMGQRGKIFLSRMRMGRYRILELCTLFSTNHLVAGFQFKLSSRFNKCSGVYT